jgi:hypothetical protein
MRNITPAWKHARMISALGCLTERVFLDVGNVMRRMRAGSVQQGSLVTESVQRILRSA